MREDARLPLVSIVASFKAGLLAETAANNGITRLLSRVLLKGTARRTAEQLADEIEAVGGSISSDAGNNSDQRLRPSDAARSPARARRARRRAPPRLAPGERRSRAKRRSSSPASRPRRRSRPSSRGICCARKCSPGIPTACAASARRSPWRGSRATTSRRFATGISSRATACIAVFGNVNAGEVHALVAEALGALPPGEPAFSSVPQPPVVAAPREVEQLKDKQQAVLMIGFRGADMFSPDRAALELIDEASSDLGSRFFLRIREEMGLAYFVGSSHMMGLAPGPFVFYLGTDPAKLTEVKAALHEEIRKLAEHGLTEAELARAKEKLLGAQEIRNQSQRRLRLHLRARRTLRPRLRALPAERARRSQP